MRANDDGRLEVMPPKERKRVRPKPGLGDMIYRIVELRLRARMYDQTDGEAWVRLGAEELELLDDVADTLDYFRLQRLMGRTSGGRR